MAGVYISYPFCGQKCTYCNFVSGVFAPAQVEQYLAVLRAEIARHKWQWRPETLYIGGGTPSHIEPEALSGLLSALPGAPWREATIEAAPGSITPSRAECWRRLHLNRVSLGVQSFVAGELARTGRKHNAATVASDVAILRQTGIANFNIDLIAGLPGQPPATWRESLEWIERLDAPHVSVYMLEVDQDSRLGREILSGGPRYGAPEVPGEDAVAELYQIAVERLAAIGLGRYEISNFARPGQESQHNLKYWRLEPYVGFGADAHSFDGAMRSRNVESPEEYLARSQSPRAETEPARIAEERFFVGLRLSEGIRPTAEEWQRHAGPIRRFLDAGLLASDGETLRLTERGVMLSNEVFQEFIET